jgi:hypothetical protein
MPESTTVQYIRKSKVGLSYRPASLCGLAGRYEHPYMPESTISPSQGRRIWLQVLRARARICKPFMSPGINSQSGGPVRQAYLTYRPARLLRMAESIPWNRFLGSLNVYKYGLWRTIPQSLSGTIPIFQHKTAGFTYILCFTIF